MSGFNPMKTCFKCGQEKPTQMFYAHPMMADGLLGKCKECTKRDTHLRAQEKSKDPHWVLSELRRHRFKMRSARAGGKYLKTHPGHATALRKYRQQHPDKWLATRMVGNAVRDGRLIRNPCEKCGKSKTQAHHDDYTKPLEVRWLCPTCHSAHHVAVREAVLIQQCQL